MPKEATKLTDEQLGRLLYRVRRGDARKGLKSYLHDCGGSGQGDELDAVIAVAEASKAARNIAKRLLVEELSQTPRQRDETGMGTVAMMLGDIANAMAKQGVTQQDLAERTGIAQPNLSVILSGKQMPRIENLARIAEALGGRWRLAGVRK